MSIRLGNGTVVAGGTVSFPLLSTMWSDHILNDVSWLRADTFSWQSGDVYKSAYEKLVAEYATGTTETEGAITFKRTESGFKIADSTQEQAILDLYNSTGVAWYYILDTTNKRFKLPRTKYNFVGLRDSVGSYVEAGLPNITGTSNFSATGNQFSGEGAFTKSVRGTAVAGSSLGTYWKPYLDASDSNSIYGNSDTVQPPATQMYLYFFVGNYVQNQTAIDIGAMSEQLNGKVDLDMHNSQKPYIVETYTSHNYSYRIWSNNICEQWGACKDGVPVNTCREIDNSENYFSVVGTTLVGTGEVKASSERNDFRTTTSFVMYFSASAYYGNYYCIFKCK